MPYTRSWDETKPDGAVTQASDIDLVFQQLKIDLRERLDALVVDWTTDPVVPIPPGGDVGKGCKVTKSSNQTITSALATTLTFNTEVFDDGSYHDTAVNNSRITVPAVPQSPLWYVHGHVTWFKSPNVPAGDYAIGILQDGVTGQARLNQTVVTGYTNTLFTQDVFVLMKLSGVAPVYFELTVSQNSGGGVDVVNTAQDTFFEVVRLF